MRRAMKGTPRGSDLVNVSPDTLKLQHEDATELLPAKRLHIPGHIDVKLKKQRRDAGD